MSTNYQPINCDYYDRLEAWATMRTICLIRFTGEDGQIQEVSARIADLFVLEKVEYMRLENGVVLRLDVLIDVNNIPLPNHC
ncbi:hypothetical protein [Chitinophaga sp.]|uniref:hypothetical protein n=1 Tax=Chitinophaga sp. TaxID=1869181 RepID=UPI0031CE50B0